MNEPIAPNMDAASDRTLSARTPASVALDGRRPVRLDHPGAALRVATGYADIFAVDLPEGNVEGIRHHLFRVERDELIFALPDAVDHSGNRVEFIAVGGPGAEAQSIPQESLRSFDHVSVDHVSVWIRQLARLLAEPRPRWQIPELVEGDPLALAAAERRRGPTRGIAWVTVISGTARLMGLDAASISGLPLTSGLWIEAGQSGCEVSVMLTTPEADALGNALDGFHAAVVACLQDSLLRTRKSNARRLADRGELAASETRNTFERLSSIIVRRFDDTPVETDRSDPLLTACRIVAAAGRMPITIAPRTGASRRDIAAVVEIARHARFRVRQVLLRDEWWKLDAGPMVGWRGAEPVALIRERAGRYVMIEPGSGARRSVDRALAAELAPAAVTFYPPLPPRALRFRDLLGFSLRHSRGTILRVALAVIAIGLLSLVPPLIVNVLISSIIPRSELDQLTFCALGLGLSAVAAASVQVMEGLAMLRLEASIDWKLQAALIDRVLKLPASVFRDFTVGDFVDRSMGIDAARRALTGRALRGMLAGLICWFSVGLMLYYDARLGLLALALTIIRGLFIVATSAIRVYYESRHFNLQGKISGFVLQLFAGIAKLRVAAATARALAVWSKQFVVQKQYFTSSQLVANALGVFETSFPIVATLLLFAYASYAESKLLSDVGRFLAFFAAFGQSMGAVGGWASGIGESLIAIPPLRRLHPLISNAAEVSEERKEPGELTGAIELARVTFRYLPGGPPILDNVTLKIAPGEYIAIVGPSGSGKSSLFRLLLGFERAESGAVFYDAKSIETLDVSAIRRQLGVVLQTARLASGSIYDNICGGVGLPVEQAWEAARLAGIDADIKAMPMGMQTSISEGVNTLSGGQRQRIMIARAVARRPRILLFDEATSSLDNRSQSIVSDSLGELNVTRVVIAHRLSTVQRADRIVVLVDGKIEQIGTFAELIDAPGSFATFARRQLL
jgi:NHLM bacteriocin system ABC transporter ATP-binding protein